MANASDVGGGDGWLASLEGGGAEDGGWEEEREAGRRLLQLAGRGPGLLGGGGRGGGRGRRGRGVSARPPYNPYTEEGPGGADVVEEEEWEERTTSVPPDYGEEDGPGGLDLPKFPELDGGAGGGGCSTLAHWVSVGSYQRSILFTDSDLWLR